MDFHGMKRKDLQTLCKKHGIPGNLKNSEMACRLASVLQKETVIEKKISPEDSVEGHGIKDKVIVSGKGKKVTFSAETEVCEFTRSVKKRRRKNVRTSTQEPAHDLQQGGIELRRSTRSVAKGISVAGSSETESNTRKGIFKTGKECSGLDVTKAHRVPRRSKRICSSDSTEENCEVTDLMALNKVGDKDIPNELQMVTTNHDGFEFEKVARRSTRLKAKIAESCEGGETSKAGTLLPAKRPKRLVVTDNEEVKFAKNNEKEVSMDLEVKETGEKQRKDVQDDSKVEKVPRRSKRFVNDIDVQTDTQDQRRSTRLKTNTEKPSMGGGASDCRPICSAKESKEERKAKQSKGSAAVSSLEGEPEPVKNKTKKASVDFEVQTTENGRRMKVQEVSKAVKVTRRSKRLGNNVDVPLADENVKAVKGDDLEVEKASKQSMQLEKGDGQPKSSSGNDGDGKKLLRHSKRTAQDNIPGQAMSNSSKECSVIDYGRDIASADNEKKLNGNDEMQVRVRVTRNSSRHDSDKAPIVVEGNLVEKKTVKPLKRVSRRKKRDRSAEPEIDTETATTQCNLTPEKVLDKCAEFVQEDAGGSHVEARGSSKKSKTMNQECVKDKPQGMVEDLPSFSETKATESVMLAENVLDSSLEKPVDSSQRTITQKLNSELVEGEREEKLERDIVLMAAIEEEKEKVEPFIERLSPAPVQLAEEQQNSPVVLAENVLDSSLVKPADSSQRTNTQELNSELVEGEREEKLERDTVLMAATEEEKEEVASRPVLFIERLSPATVQLAKAELVAPTGHLHVEDIASTAIAEESTKTENETLVCTPRSELKEHSSVAKLAKLEEILENSAACCKDIHSSKGDEKGSLETKVQAADLHGNFSECNTEGSSAEEEMEISKVGCMSVGDCVNLATEILLDEYPQLESEEANSGNVEAASSKKMKTVDQEFVKDKPYGMDEGSPSTSEIKATEPVMIFENVLDSTPKISGDVSLLRNTQELNSEREEEHEQDADLMAATKDAEETSSLSVFPIEGSEMKTCPDNRATGGYLSLENNPPPAAAQLAVSNPEAELGLPTGPILVKGNVSTVIAEENAKTKDDTLICTSRSEIKQHSSVAKLAKVEAILENTVECCKVIHWSKDNEKGSLEKDLQAATLHRNIINYTTENRSAEEDMEISKVGCIPSCVNLTPEKLLDACTQLVSEEKGGSNVETRGSSKKMKTVNQECAKPIVQGMSEDSPFTSETKATEPVMLSEKVLDSTQKSSVDISAGRNTQELNSELVKGERKEKHEQDTVLMDAIKGNEEASSLSVFFIKRPEVSSPNAEPFVETTPPPASVDLAVSNPEAELDMPTGHIRIEDIASPVIAEEDNKTKEEIHNSIPKPELKEHSFVAKLAEAEAILENSADCWKEIHSSKDDEQSSAEEQAEISNVGHCNFSEYNTENSSADEQADISKVGHCVNVETLDEVKDDNLEKAERTISSERSYKLNAPEARGWSTGFASLSPEETNVSECFEEGEMKALSQPIPIQKASSSDLDESAVFTTPERNLMLMEQVSENGKKKAVESPAVVFTTPEQVLLLGGSRLDGKTRAVDSVTHHSDKAVESPAVVFTTPEKVLLLGGSRLDEAGKEKEHTTTDFPEEPAVHNTTERYLMMGGSRQNKATNEGESIMAELHDESDIATSLVKQSSVGSFKGEGENITVELHCESGTCTKPDRHALLGNSVSDGTENKAMEFYKESVVHTSLERRVISGCFGQDKAREGEEQKDAQFSEESGLSTGLHKDQPVEGSELGEAGWQENDGVNKYGDSEQKKPLETGEKVGAEFHDVSAAVPNIPETHPFPEDSESDEAVKSEAKKAVELEVGCSIFTSAEKHVLREDQPVEGSELGDAGWQEIDGVNKYGDSEKKKAIEIGVKSEAKKAVELEVGCSICTSAEKHLLLDTDEGMKGDNLTARSHVVSDAFIAAESQSLMGDEAEKTYSENRDVELLGESSIFTNLERHLLSEDSEQDGTRKTVANCDFASLERRQFLNNAGKQEQKEDDFAFFSMLESRSLLGVSEHDRLDIGKSDLSQYESRHSSSPIFNSNDYSVVLGSHAAENISVDSNGCVSYSHEFIAGRETASAKFMPRGSESENVAGLDPIQGTLTQSRGGHFPRVEAIIEAESDVSLRPYVLALPAKGNFESDGENPSYLKVAGTCSMVPESCPFMDTTKQINDALEEVSITDELMKNTQSSCEGNLLLNSSGGFYASGKTSVLAETEDRHSLIATAYDSTLTEKAISPTPDESAVQNYMNEQETAADEEMVGSEATPSPEETLKQSSENRNVDESGMLSERQVRRETNLIYTTQVKPKRHDMKENAPNSKIVRNLNVTAPRTSKRQPLQDLKKN